MKPNHNTKWEPVTVNSVNSVICIPHWGVTLRTLFGAAIAAWPDPTPGACRDFRITYKGADIALLHVKQHHDI